MQRVNPLVVLGSYRRRLAENKTRCISARCEESSSFDVYEGGKASTFEAIYSIVRAILQEGSFHNNIRVYSDTYDPVKEVMPKRS